MPVGISPLVNGRFPDQNKLASYTLIHSQPSKNNFVAHTLVFCEMASILLHYLPV